MLYNLHRAKEAIRKEDRVILVEGYMDAIGVTAAGFANVVASCGTSLTAQQVQAHEAALAARIVGAISIPTRAGANAAERSIDLLLEEGMHVRIVELDGGLDPDEYCKRARRGGLPGSGWTAPRATSIGWRTARAPSTTCARAEGMVGGA